jgi:hypothetical protein
MKLDLLEPFDRVPYFTINGFRQMMGSDMDDPARARECLHRWKQAGHIILLKRGIYMTRRFFETHRADADFAPSISAVLLPISYVSLEYILQRGGVLTEATYPVTAVTVKNTRTIQNPVGTFVYRHIKPALYVGFQLESYYGIIFHTASLAKALFDYLYLRPLPRQMRKRDLDLAEDLRLNLGDFSLEMIDEFEGYVGLSASEKMEYILTNLRRNVWQH